MFYLQVSRANNGSCPSEEMMIVARLIIKIGTSLRRKKVTNFNILPAWGAVLNDNSYRQGRNCQVEAPQSLLFRMTLILFRSLKLIQNNRIIRIQYQTNDQKRCGMGITTATDNYNHLKCYIIDFLRQGECANSYHFLIWTMKVYHKHEAITCRHLKRKNGVYKVNDSYEFSKVKENTLSEETIRFCSDLRISCQ